MSALASPQYATPFAGQASVEDITRLAAILKENSGFLREAFPKLKEESLKKQLLQALVSLGGLENKKLVLDVIAAKAEPIDLRREALGQVTAALPGPRSDDQQAKPFVAIDDLGALHERLADPAMRE